MRPVRLALTIAAGILVLGVVWAAWQTWQVSRSLSAAADDARSLQTAIDESDQAGVDEALERLEKHASDADGRTGGTTWSLMTHAPMFGDDAKGVRLVSSVLGDLTSEGFSQLAESAADLDAYLPREGKIPLDSLQGLQDPVSQADIAFAEADRRLSAEDPSGYVGPLKTNYEDLAARIADASSGLSTATKALALLPDMLGGAGPRNYLLIFQNNAEIRATGGLPGAWALVHADDGALEIERQGTASDFLAREGGSILPLTPEEEQAYGPQLGEYFQDANFTPDFTRSAELWHAWWDATFPATGIDGVLSVDPVAMSYLLDSTGPVTVGDVTLTSENAVAELLNAPYIEKDPTAQDAFFAEAGRAVFTAVTGSLQSPVGFLRALSRATVEGRVHVNSFIPEEQAQIDGTSLAGELPDDDGAHPHVQIAINDATGSKMSYYLRYRASVDARDCSGGVQSLLGTLSLNQSMPAAEAAILPAAVTGGGQFGIAAGKQLVIARIYGPTGGSLSNLRIDGKTFDSEVIQLNGRPVMVVVVELSGPDDVLVSWSMQTKQGQEENGTVGVTPSVAPGAKSSTIPTAC